MYDRPNPADQDKCQKPLTHTEKKGHSIEVPSNASGNHSTDSRCEGDAVEDEAHDGEGVIEADDCLLASANCLTSSFFDHIN